MTHEARRGDGRPERIARPRLVHLAFATVLTLGASNAVVARTAAQPVSRAQQAIDAAGEAIERLHFDEAERQLAALPAGAAQSPAAAFLRGSLAFQRGAYADAARELTTAAPHEPAARELLGLVQATISATSEHHEFRSADGRYRVLAAREDELLVPYALDVMAAADAAITREVGHRHPGPIRLELYDSPQRLAAVSTLTEEEIERTGTIALCKWDRLMVTSPRALVRGYPWVDTIAHELVHLVLSRASADRAPVWLQEGIAKLLERSWRGGPRRAQLDPVVRRMLLSAARNDRLIPFERLHPSIARLPSQRDAALAFAQVATFLELAFSRASPTRIADALERIAAGTDAREALATAAQTTFDALEGSWREGLTHDSTATAPAPAADGEPSPIALRFKRGSQAADDSVDVSSVAARRHVRLGELLSQRSRARAAGIEFARAFELAPSDPIVATRHATALVDGGRATEALPILERVIGTYGDYFPARLAQGRALVAAGREPESREAFREAIREQPFDSTAHCALAAAPLPAAEHERETRACAATRRPAP